MENGSNYSCVNVSDIFNLTKPTLPVTLVSSLLSILGSTLIIIPFIIWKDVRKSSARKILFFLAVADFCTGCCFFAAVVGRLIINPSLEKYGDLHYLNYSIEYINFCVGQAFFTVYFQCVSFFLTSTLAIYFFTALVCKRPKLSRKLMVGCIVMSWSAPLITCGYVFNVNGFGIGDSRSSVGWCFIDNRFVQRAKTKSEHDHYVADYFILELVSEKLWEIMTLFIIIISYFSILLMNRCRYRKVSYNFHGMHLILQTIEIHKK